MWIAISVEFARRRHGRLTTAIGRLKDVAGEHPSMKLRQNVRHWASKQALTMPVVGEKVSDWLVDLHTRVFLDRADEGAPRNDANTSTSSSR